MSKVSLAPGEVYRISIGQGKERVITAFFTRKPESVLIIPVGVITSKNNSIVERMIGCYPYGYHEERIVS